MLCTSPGSLTAGVVPREGGRISFAARLDPLDCIFFLFSVAERAGGRETESLSPRAGERGGATQPRSAWRSTLAHGVDAARERRRTIDFFFPTKRSPRTSLLFRELFLRSPAPNVRRNELSDATKRV